MCSFLLPAGPCDVAVNVPDMAALETEVSRRLAEGEGFALATLNLDHVVKLRRDASFREAYARHELVTADGNPIVWLSRMAGHGVALIPGSDLILPLCRLAAVAGAPVALLGATETALRGASRRLKEEVPGLEVAARVAPPMGFDPEGHAAEAALQEVAEAGARLVFLALGAPKQERLAARGRRLHPGLGFVSIGAGLDFLAGTQRRAPEFVRELALEWLWRMVNDPRRLARRYVDSAAVLPGLVWRVRRQA
ncbi:WecB/TagA/CpsF family glycosyltransferase [Pseudoroseicyclus tamaricis]|uniref:WecB/TagA/CpsF family glycosyltransferase n=1 Tax=Pseudoroseicyclus tamaricis TaxID=2705421 RepID=A0A6B2JSC2_9RHOB|nr:WecB/TagA/CpsF family glycosyltransferase [Pseudoroseicyclus tamaricis]NDU99478.1 WecB/TagA/CpsF family glycosyltransferase [Pseudoroseicyclus tamaricis]